MCIFKNKFEKLTREEVIDTICSLERDEALAEESIALYTDKIKNMMDEGKNMKDILQRTLLVKKITLESEKRERAMRQAMYLLYNLRLSIRLKDAIDDKSLVDRLKSIRSIKYFKDQRALALFLNKALNTKIKEENVLTDADDTFKVIEEMFSSNKQIYGIADINEDSLMAFFEEENTLNELNLEKEDVQKWK